MRANRFDRALADFNAALKLQPGYVKALANRGYVYVMMGDYDRAKQDLEKAIALNPSAAVRDRRARAHAPPQGRDRSGARRSRSGGDPEPAIHVRPDGARRHLPGERPIRSRHRRLRPRAGDPAQPWHRSPAAGGGTCPQAGQSRLRVEARCSAPLRQRLGRPRLPPAQRPDTTVSVGQETDVGKLFSLAETLFRNGDIDGSIGALDRLAADRRQQPQGLSLSRPGIDQERRSGARRRRVRSRHRSQCELHRRLHPALRVAARSWAGSTPAAADAEHLVRVAGSDARSFNVRGLVRMQQGRERAGPRRLRPCASRSTPSSASSTRTARSPTGRWATPTRLLADLSRALAVNPKSARAVTIRGEIYIAQREIDRAIAEFKQATRPSTRTTSRRSSAFSRRSSPSRCRSSTRAGRQLRADRRRQPRKASQRSSAKE